MKFGTTYKTFLFFFSGNLIVAKDANLEQDDDSRFSDEYESHLRFLRLSLKLLLVYVVPLCISCFFFGTTTNTQMIASFISPITDTFSISKEERIYIEDKMFHSRKVSLQYIQFQHRENMSFNSPEPFDLKKQMARTT